jgi:putative oxidoreductase
MSAIAMTIDRSSHGLLGLAAGAIGLLGRFPDALLLLVARVAPAAVFFKSGLNKTDNWDSTVDLFTTEYKVPVLPPEIAAYLGTAAELICPILLVLGLGARFGAAALLGMTFVIQTFVYPLNYAEHLTWAALLLLVLTRGAGALSIDHLIRRAVLGAR